MYFITYLIQRSKKLSYLLRHDKSYAFDEHGWREVSDLVANNGFTMEELREIVATNNKQRYERLGVEMATKVGARHGEPVVLAIDAKRMSEDGNKFFLSRNGIWLTEFVDAKYITEVVG